MPDYPKVWRTFKGQWWEESELEFTDGPDAPHGRVVPVGALIIERDENGGWPDSVVRRVAYAISGPLVPDDERRSVAEMAARAALDSLVIPLPDEGL